MRTRTKLATALSVPVAAVALTASPAAALHDYHQGMPSRHIDVVFTSVSSCRSTPALHHHEGRVEPLPLVQQGVRPHHHVRS